MIHNSHSIPDLAMNWVVNHRNQNSTARNTIIIVSDLAWTALSASVCFPSVIATLSEAKGSLLQKIFGFGSVAGTGLDWFVLTTYGGVVFIHLTLAKKTDAEKILFKETTHTLAKIAQIVVSIGLGLATRAPALTEAVKFSKDKALGKAMGLESAIGEAGLPALGQYMQIEMIKKFFRLKFSQDKRERQIESLRQRLIEMTKVALNKGLRQSFEDREFQFLMLYRRQTQEELLHIGSSLTQLCQIIHSIYQEAQEKALDCDVMKWPRRAVQFIGSSNCIGLFIMDALLARTAYEILHADSGLTDLGMVLAFGALLYIAPQMSWNAAAQNFNLIYDMFGSRDNKSFADEFYPKISRLLKLLCGLLSVLQYDEEIALTKLYASIDSVRGRLLSISNIVACSLIISASYYYLIENMLEFYSLSRFSSQEVRHAAVLKEKLGRFIELLQNIQPLELSQMVAGIEDNYLKQQLLNRIMTPQELIRYIQDQTEDDQTALLLSEP
jgi:hypothetical protein